MKVKDIISEIESDIKELEQKRKFNPFDGTHQLTGKDKEAYLDYGKYIALVSLWEQINDSTWTSY